MFIKMRLVVRLHAEQLFNDEPTVFNFVTVMESYLQLKIYQVAAASAAFKFLYSQDRPP